MTSDRLERAVQSMHSIGMSLATLVVMAIGADKASSSFDLGGLSHALLYASLGCFVITGVAGGHLITTLPLMEGEVEDVMKRPAPLVGGQKRGLLPLHAGVWHQIQHWALLSAIGLGILGGLAVATAEADPGSAAASTHAAAPAKPAS